VLVTVEYRITRDRPAEFLEAIQPLVECELQRSEIFGFSGGGPMQQCEGFGSAAQGASEPMVILNDRRCRAPKPT
jgi:hypothetical protein